eukprot:8657186-Pyramimonas_sp.AAC.1
MERGIVHCAQWCDARDLTADGHAKGGHGQRHALASHRGNAILQARSETTLPTGQATRDHLSHLRSRYMQGYLPAR